MYSIRVFWLLKTPWTFIQKLNEKKGAMRVQRIWVFRLLTISFCQNGIRWMIPSFEGFLTLANYIHTCRHARVTQINRITLVNTIRWQVLGSSATDEEGWGSKIKLWNRQWLVLLLLYWQFMCVCVFVCVLCQPIATCPDGHTFLSVIQTLSHGGRTTPNLVANGQIWSSEVLKFCRTQGQFRCK